MQILCDSRSIQTALQCQTELGQHITGYVDRLSDEEGFELGNLVHFVVMHRDDTVVELEAALGFSVMTNRSKGCRYCSGKLISSVLAGVFAGGVYRCHGAIFRLL